MWRGFVLFLLLLFGCQSFNPVGPAIQLGMYWVDGEAHKYYNTDQESMLVAVREVLNTLEIPIHDEEVSDGMVVIHAGGKFYVEERSRRFARKDSKVLFKIEDRFKIKLIVVKPHTTKVSIRCNIFGDKPYCDMIYRHIDGQSSIKQFVTLVELNSSR